MNCKKIQEFIITDYIDTRMGDKQKSLIDQHLAHCRTCEDFLTSVKNEVIAPFNNAHKVVPDGFLWARIKRMIEEEHRQLIEKRFVPDFWERLGSAVHIPRPAFAFATILTMIFMIGTTGQLFMQSPLVKINGPDQIQYLSSLFDDPINDAGNNGNDPQSPIEEYFL